jgi:hypothetical protein
MSEIKKIQEAAKQYRNEANTRQRAVQEAKAKLEQEERQYKSGIRGVDATVVPQEELAFDNSRKKLQQEYAEATSQRKQIREEFLKNYQAYLPKLNPITAIEELEDAYPILLLPLRLEIRFKQIRGQHQLWLRVYPDDCHVQHKETLLSESELNNVQQFWIQLWKSGGVELDERAAWTSLVNAHGSGRAAYLITEYKPADSPPIKANAQEAFLILTSNVVLTATEQSAAENYWIDYWLANGDVVKIEAAQSTLLSIVGASLLEQIVTNYIPENINDTVPEGILRNQVFIHHLTLPEYTPKVSSWSEAPVAELLPDKFVCILQKAKNTRTEIFAHGVHDNLPVGPDPSLPPEEQVKKDDNGNLIVNEALQWSVDFEKAVSVGMATKINLTPQEYQGGFDSLKVIGIRFSSDAMQSKTELENLLTNHFYSKNGFGLLKQGTPTNNTEDLPSGYTWIDDPDESYERIFKHREDFNETEDLEARSDGEHLADALGIDTGFLKLVPNANSTDQLEANAMNKALFPATMGYFLEEMMHPLFSESDISNTKTFFANYVSGRGSIPAIRIGKQPYGILPVSVYSRLNFGKNADLTSSLMISKSPFVPKLYSLLKKLDTDWNNFVPAVPFVGKQGGDPHQMLIDILGLHANSVEWHQRYAQSLNQLYNQLKLLRKPNGAKKTADAIAARGKLILQRFGLDADLYDLPILKKFFTGKAKLLKGPFIDDVPDSETTPVRAYSVSGKNYIDWLATSDANTVRIEDFGGNPSPTALLYILLRHSLMQAQADAASNLLVSNQLIKDKSVYYDPDFLHIEKDGGGKSKFEHLYASFPAITGNDQKLLAEHIYEPQVLASRKETLRLNETLEALQVLKQVPTARLERLLTEHLDCCNYRLDAWFTGLVRYKLQTLRETKRTDKEKGKGLYLGGYGWLLNIKPENKVMTPVQLSNELSDLFKPDDGSTLVSDTTNLGYIHAPSLNQAATAAILRNAYDSNKDAGSGNPFSINLNSERVRLAEGFLEGIRNGQSLSALLGYQFERGLHDKYSLGEGEVDKFIYPLRKVFPLASDLLEDTKTEEDVSIESIEARNVLDGLKFIQHVESTGNSSYPFGFPASKGLPAANSTEALAINSELKKIIEINDAIGDLVMAEQVYQTVLGNITRATGNADAYSKGNHPPTVEVKDTPRTGITLTHRMTLQLHANATAPVGAHARTVAEPALSEWLHSILPNPSNVGCWVTYSSPVTPETSVTVTQADLGLDAMDLLYTLESNTEQAMNELDDRIMHHVRYTLSQHPNTQLFIRYTESVDAADRSKISFFELSALINRIRKIVQSNRYVQPHHLALSQAGENVLASMNDSLLKQRVEAVRNMMDAAVQNAEAVQSGIVSIAALTASFSASLSLHTSDAALISSISNQMETDLKSIVQENSAAHKDILLTALETNLATLANPAAIAALKTEYGIALEDYWNDFTNLDSLIEDASLALQQISLVQAEQCGTGFMHQAVQRVYQRIADQCQVVVERNVKTQIRFDTLMAGYQVAGNATEQFALLQQAEQLISVEITTVLPADFNDYKTNIVDVKKAGFDTVLLGIQNLTANPRTQIVDYLQDVNQALINLSLHDPISYNQELKRNDVAAEKLQLALLKEDIANALLQVITTQTSNLTAANTLLGEADLLSANTDKITAYLQSAKKILGDDAILIPQFNLDSTTGNEFEKVYQAGINEDLLQFAKTKGKHILPVEDWLGGVARVKEKVQDWEHVQHLTEAFNPTQAVDLVPMQFPFETNDRWLGLKFKDETNAMDEFKINGDKLLLTSHFATPFQKTEPLCGILIDDWTEVIPHTEETTGIAFHYDQPNSEPPQTILLLTAPQQSGHWNWNDVVDTLDETLAMAKKRAVEPAQIEQSNYAQFLPTTMMAVSYHWITVAANLSMNNNIYTEIKKK